ncbi:MAG: hypothetical protein IJ874_07220 [Ruminococcus sp.]|nr:hypothetical protein [Ruminococcus sp.]
MAGFYCFADFEFTCGYGIDLSCCEMLSAGAVVCDESLELRDRFYLTACPVVRPKMTKQCKKLTKLSQEEIYASHDSSRVTGQMLKMLKKYDIRTVWVWGNFDSPALGSDARCHKARGLDYVNIRKLQGMITDIQRPLVKQLGLPEAVSIKELSAVFGYSPQSGEFHNALNDAEAFYTIYKAAYTTDISENTALQELKEERLRKIIAARERAAQQRLETALSLPLTDREREYFSTLAEDSRERELFVRIRARVVRAQEEFADGTPLVAFYFSDTRSVKVYQEEGMPEVKTNRYTRSTRFIKGQPDIMELL